MRISEEDASYEKFTQVAMETALHLSFYKSTKDKISKNPGTPQGSATSHYVPRQTFFGKYY